MLPAKQDVDWIHMYPVASTPDGNSWPTTTSSGRAPALRARGRTWRAAEIKP